MTLTQLSYIVAVDNFRSFAAAAKQCFVTQPTLSMQIQKLENELGILIFDRSKQPVSVTEIGSKVINQARIILQESARIKDIISIESKEITGSFKLGIIPTIAPYLLPMFIEEFVTKYPRLKLIIDEIQTHQIIEKLKKDELDAGILATPLNDTDINEMPLYYEPFAAYVSSGHRLYDNEKIKMSDLSIEDLFLLKEGHCFRDHTIQICKDYGENRNDMTVSRQFNFEGGTLDTLMRLVENNFGMTLIPYLAINEFVLNNRLNYIRYFEDPVPKREISIVFHRAHLKKHIIELLAGEIKAVISEELLSKESSYIVGN